MLDDNDNHDAVWPRLLVARVWEYAIFRLTEQDGIASWNPGARRIVHYEADEIIGRHFSVLYTDDDRNSGMPEAHLSAARDSGQHDSEGWRVRRDGKKIWASVLVMPLFTADGRFAGFGAIVRDTTDKRMAYEAVIESERRFRLLVQGVSDYAIFMLSPEGLVTNWNL